MSVTTIRVSEYTGPQTQLELVKTTALSMGEAVNSPYDLLGYAFSLKLHEVAIPVSIMEELMLESGLDLKYMPKPPRADHAFKSATDVFKTSKRYLRQVEFHNKVFTNSRGEKIVLDGVYKILLMDREVSEDRESIVRNIVREIIDEKGKKLIHGTVIQLVFDKKSQNIEMKYFDGSDKEPYIQELVDKFLKTYDQFKMNFRSNVLRYMFYRMFEDSYTISYDLADGLRFISAENKSLLDAIERFFELIKPFRVQEAPQVKKGCVVRSDSKRVAESFIEEAKKQVENIRTELRGKNGAVSPTIYKRYLNEMAKLKDGLEYYKEMLDNSLEAADLEVAALDAELRHLKVE